MLRDSAPIHSLGHGVTSRDAPIQEGETQGPSPNSGYIANALNGNPVMRFFAHTATSLVVAGVLTRLTKSGGLRLGRYLQENASDSLSNKFSTRAVKSAVDIRRALDELQGVERHIDGQDPYSELVFKQDGRLTTGYLGKDSERFGFNYLTESELNQAALRRGITGEPPAVWTWREELQKRLVRSGRRLPYELPALYAAQRGITDTLFGTNEDKPQVKWYNPVDVVADFTKQSLINVATAIAPFEFAGAGASNAKSSLRTLKYSLDEMRSLTPVQKKMSRHYVNLEGLLSEVGHDLAGLTNRFLRVSAQTSGALASATTAQQDKHTFVFSLRDLKNGLSASYSANAAASGSKAKGAFEASKDAFFGRTGQNGIGAVDLLPGLSGATKALKRARQDFTLTGKAYDALEGAIAYDKALRSLDGVPESALQAKMKQLRGMHSSGITRFAEHMERLGSGGPSSASFTKSDFYVSQQKEAFKKLIAQELRSSNSNLSKNDVQNLVDHLNIGMTRPGTHNTNMVTLGKSRIISNSDNPESFFEEILQRFRQHDSGQSVYSQITPNAFDEAVSRAKTVAYNAEFKRGLHNKIVKQWGKQYNQSIVSAGESVLKPVKRSYQEFTGPMTTAKAEFLQKKTAETLGIKLIKTDGTKESLDQINNKLRDRGIDPTNFADLRNFLMNRKKLSSGIFSGGFNIFGSRPFLLENAQESGYFSFLSDNQKKIISDVSGAMATEGPVNTSAGLSAIRGMYQTSGGRILDVTSVKSTFADLGDFFATQFKIPVLGFNPAGMFGYGSFKEMAKRSPIQYVPGSTVQPFGDLPSTRADFYIWQTRGGFKGTKGSVTAYSTDQMSGAIYGKTLSGTYRPVPTKSSEMYTRQARLAAGMGGMTTDEIHGVSGLTAKFKRLFDVDSEQPNSLFRMARRFRERKGDPFNESVMAKLLSGEEIQFKKSGKMTRVSLQVDDQTGAIRGLDQAGTEVLSEEQIIRGYHNLRKATYPAGFSRQIMGELEESSSDLFTYGGQRVSKMSDDQLSEFAEDLLRARSGHARIARDAGVSELAVYGPSSRIGKLLAEGDLSETSKFAYKSGTITTRADQLRKEVFSYVYETNQIKLFADNPQSSLDTPFVKITEAISQMVRQGRLNPAQRAEAQAAAASGLFNLSAFSQYKGSVLNIENERNAISYLMSTVGGNRDLQRLFDPFKNGQMDFLANSFRQKFSPIIAPLKSAFKTGGYQVDPMAIDPLGSGQDITLVPTFGTVFAKDAKKALKSATGLTTYSDPEYFSGGSIPVSHSIERLNRYFGSIGLSLDTNKYSGPLDLFARGMVMKRVLPAYAVGTSLMAVDRTAGGMVQGTDDRGERIYSPLVAGTVARGIVEAQALAAGMAPGGMTYEEKREQLLEGEVPIRQGRYWPLGNTPFKGGKIMYYRPSWYQKLQAGSAFTSDTYGSPAEKFLFYNDISPLRPLDPYRFERKHYEDRPYPVTGEYFTGPFGPLVPLANMTIGKVLKPQRQMHSEEVAAGLASYVPAGEFGAYDATAYMPQVTMGGISTDQRPPRIVPVTGSGQTYGGPNDQISSINSTLAARAGATNLASGITSQNISTFNSQYLAFAYGPPKVSGVMAPEIVPSGAPIQPSALPFQFGEFGYRTQEMLGIYGFGAASLRNSLGFGQGDFEPQRAVLQSASTAYSTSREFWDLNLGGLGDVPLSSSGPLGNIEFSEIVRRFVPKERGNVDYINPIRNTMGYQYPFLPGPEYFTDFTRGDPFTKVQEGIVRLPGVAYERLNRLYSDEYGKYGLLDQYNILSDVAPYSRQFKQLDQKIDSLLTEPDQRVRLQEIRSQLENTTKKNEFSDYKYRGMSAEDLGMYPAAANISRFGEMLAHSDNFLMYKAFGKRTAIEDWERGNVYGTSFPEWQRPFESYIEPMIQKSTQQNPIVAAATLGTVGSLFGRTAKAKFLGTAVGSVTGIASGSFGNAYEAITGERFVPLKEKQRVALEEYTDILTYTKNTRLSKMAEMSGDAFAANQYRMAAERTMYGADLYSRDVETLALAVPKRKREHFMEMIQAPEKDRERVLSTAGRLERRLYQAAWGMEVERRPDLVEYFSRHELPDTSWEGWHPNTNMEQVKIKMGQSMGVEMSQMGYYPQQIKQANLANPSYPQFDARSDNQDAAFRLRRLLSGMGITGSVSPVLSPYSNGSVGISAGVY
jgi:hypothetical protein